VQHAPAQTSCASVEPEKPLRLSIATQQPSVELCTALLLAQLWNIFLVGYCTTHCEALWDPPTQLIKA
jgi:hypothetical protein